MSTAHDCRDVRIFEKECTSLAEAGYEVWYLTPGAPDALSQGVHTRPIPLGRRTGLFSRYLRRLHAVYRCAAAVSADIYHFHDPELIPVGIALKYRGARVIYDAHEDAPVEALSLNRDRRIKGYVLSGLWWLFTAVAVRYFDGIIAATPTIATKLKPGAAVVVHNFPRLECFRDTEGRLASRRDPHRLVYVGNITRIRGLLQMLEALGIVSQRQPCRLRLIGRFDSEPLKAEAEAHPAWRLVDYLGWLPWTAAIDEMRRAGVGLLLLHPTPEYIPSMPTKLFEYMAAGIPVVCSDFPFLRQVVTAADGGDLVDPLDPASIAEAIAGLLAAPEHAAAQGRSGARYVNRFYSWDSQAAELLSLYAGMGLVPSHGSRIPARGRGGD